MRKGIIFDVETTGFRAGNGDEILQLSAIDEDGNVLFDKYFKPCMNEEWPGAEKIHGITPEQLQDEEYFSDCKEQIQALFDDYNCLIGYNVGFDIRFLQTQGINLAGIPCVDVMEEFAIYYNQTCAGNKRSYKLVFAAEYFNYEKQGNEFHNALEDVRATLHCFKKVTEF